jgi:hypothetical protein
MKTKVFGAIAALAVLASAAMFMIGKNSTHMSELKTLFWVPLPLAVVFGILAFVRKKGS